MSGYIGAYPSSLFKYGETASRVTTQRRGPVTFSRTHIDGLPYRGPVHSLKEEEYQSLKTKVSDAYVKLFRLSDPQDVEELTTVIDRAANNWYTIVRMREKFVEGLNGTCDCYVYCVWVEPYYEVASQAVPSAFRVYPNAA